MRRCYPFLGLLAVLMQLSPAWSDEADQQAISKMNVTVGFVEQVGDKMTADVNLHNGSGRFYAHIEATCSALDKRGAEIANTSAYFSYVEDGANGEGVAIFDFDKRVDKVLCEVKKVTKDD